jgi:hypothetical protein
VATRLRREVSDQEGDEDAAKDRNQDDKCAPRARGRE